MLPPLNAIHAIRRWSGKPQDERPICGADPTDPSVAINRTIYHATVTCAACLDVLADDRCSTDDGTRTEP